MQNNQSKIVRIKTDPQKSPLSPAQKRFNQLIKQIDKAKSQLTAWQQAQDKCRQEAAGKLTPLQKSYADQQAALVTLMDKYVESHKFNRKQSEKIAYLVSEICFELIDVHQRDDMKPLYDKYNAQTFEDEMRQQQDIANEFLKAKAKDDFGIDLGDFEFDFSDPEALFRHMTEKFEDQFEHEQTAQPKRKKTAKQLAKEAREKEEQTNISKSIQAVYRQLVGALHPDREPDTSERDRKTELMKKVTVAYENKDLLKLLELQLHVEQIDQHKINQIADDKLKHYNKVLKNQLDELRDEVSGIEGRFRIMLDIPLFSDLTPMSLLKYLQNDIKEVKYKINCIKGDLAAFQDVKTFKTWLNQYRIPEPELPFDFPEFM